jgi:hypothetical protein
VPTEFWSHNLKGRDYLADQNPYMKLILKCKSKSKVVPIHNIKAYGVGMGWRHSSLHLNLSTNWRQAFSFNPGHFTPSYPLNRMQSGPWSRTNIQMYDKETRDQGMS